jgi:flagellin
MSINIGTNIPSLTAQRNLGASTGRLNTAYERLSSGMRINKARDDAAGLSIAESLKADSVIASVAIRNANDGISLISIADQAIGQITNVLTRLAELSQQSANGVYSDDQRAALQLEFQALGSEIQRIAETTEFNKLPLLSGSQEVSFQIGFDGTPNSRVGVSGIDVTLADLGLATSGSAQLAYSILDLGGNSQEAARVALDAINAAIGSATKLRGTLGAAESRLEVAIGNLTVARENFKAAESRIRDVDVAAEAAELTRLNILQQAGAAILAQANQQPSLALSLLS